MIDLLGQITEKAYCFRRIDAVENKYLYNSTSGKAKLSHVEKRREIFSSEI